jgi:hypothetical protein
MREWVVVVFPNERIKLPFGTEVEIDLYGGKTTKGHGELSLRS